MHWMMNEQNAMAAREDGKRRCLAFVDMLEHGGDVDAVLDSAGFSVMHCDGIQSVCDELMQGADALLVSETGLRAEAADFRKAIASRSTAPALPTIVILDDDSSGEVCDNLRQLLELLRCHGPLFFVPSPIRRDVLFMTAQSAASARQAQVENASVRGSFNRVQQRVGHCEESVLAGGDECTCEEAQDTRHADRIASMGTLAAGLGHDLGNLVFPLRIRVDLMRSRDVCPELSDELDAIYNAVQYLQRLANGLRHMAMDPSETGIGVESVDLSEWWTDVEPLLRNALSRGMKLEQRFERRLPRIPVAAHGLTQAVFNLVQNASEAMVHQGAGRVVVSAKYHDGMVQLAVSDDGPGMSEAVRRRCVEPFFTTKVRSISTGLGLALARGVVMRAGGTIGVVSEVGVGTKWTMSFPIAKCSDVQTRNGTQQQATVALEDTRLAAFAAAMLRTLDFDVRTIEASKSPPAATTVWVTDDCDAALAYVDEDPSRFAVVLSAESPRQHPRMLHTGGLTTSGAIRRALRDLVQALDGARLDSART